MNKLSKKERNEVVTKGYLVDYLENKNYVTQEYFQTQHNKLLSEFERHTGVLLEELNNRMDIVVEGMNARTEAMKKDFRSKRSASEIWLSNHEDRLSRLEKTIA